MSDDLADLRAVAEAASGDGAWKARGSSVIAPVSPGVEVAIAREGIPGFTNECTDDIAAYIASFDPPTVLGLLDRLAAAEAAVERVRSLADELVWIANEVDPAEEFVYADELRAALEGDA